MIESQGRGDRGFDTKNNLNWEPLEVIDDFDFSPSFDRYPAPFASQAEVDGFFSGSEHWTLYTSDESIYSRDFVQCSAALVRNRQTGKTTLIHESTWSTSATVALGIQRAEDIDIITIAGPFGGMLFSDLKYFHEKDAKETDELLQTINEIASKRCGSKFPGKENMANIFGDYSALLGLSKEDLESIVKKLTTNSSVGETHCLGNIHLPVSKGEANRWYLLYRPEENIVWIYESGTKKLFKYPGFNIHNNTTFSKTLNINP